MALLMVVDRYMQGSQAISFAIVTTAIPYLNGSARYQTHRIREYTTANHCCSHTRESHTDFLEQQIAHVSTTVSKPPQYGVLCIRRNATNRWTCRQSEDTHILFKLNNCKQTN